MGLHAVGAEHARATRLLRLRSLARERDLRAIDKEVLVIDGREDRIIPLSNAYKLLDHIPRAQLIRLRMLRPLDADRGQEQSDVFGCVRDDARARPRAKHLESSGERYVAWGDL